jgi:hypothetical protein
VVASCTALLGALLLLAWGFAPPAVAAGGVEPRFDLAAPSGSPFPSNRFTVADSTQLTGLRVDLPKPDCRSQLSDCDDLDVLNTLDGFNLQPRLSIPFTGPIDLATVTSDTVFLFKLSCAACTGGSFVGVNQIVWDPATNTLHAESDEFLDQHARYLLVVTKGVRDASGNPIESAQFRHVLDYGQTKDAAEKAYRAQLLTALDRLEAAGVPTGKVAAASIFTTQSATAAMEKIRDQLKAAAPAPPDFRLGANGERTVFPLANVASIAFARQITTAPTFSTSLAPIGADGLNVIPGTVGTVAFGKYLSPDYQTADGVIPPVATRTGRPAPQGTTDVYFNLFLPAGTPPPGGWPVVIAGHGGGGNKNTANVLLRVAKPAQHGLATITINTVGHGGGPLGTLTVNRSDETSVTLPAGGRGIDQNRNGVIGNGLLEPDEGLLAAPPQRIVLIRDGIRQTVVDLMQLVREIQVGIDVDGDGSPDLDRSHISYFSGSLGGVFGTVFTALEPSVRAGVLNVTGGALVELARLNSLGPYRGILGRLLSTRTPSLLNGGPDPINAGNPLPFNENMPFRNEQPRVNTIPGAIAIQEQIERLEWVGQSGDPVAYAPHLRKQPLAGVPARPVLVPFAKGDPVLTNPLTTALLRAGDLTDRTMYFRNDLAYEATNGAIGKVPHEYLTNFSPAGIGPALAGQEAIAIFLASDGQTIIDPDATGPLFEVPITGPLPEQPCFMLPPELCFIP